MVSLYMMFDSVLRVKLGYLVAIVAVISALVIIFKKPVKDEGELSQIYEERKIKKTGWVGLIFFLVVLAAWSPYVFRGQDVHVKIFDNMDCHVPQTKVLAESGKAFSLDTHTKLDNFINGLPLSGVDSGYNLMTWLFMLLPPFWAFAINDLLVKLFAFFGMALLLKRYVIPKDNEYRGWLIYGPALSFSLLPFYPAGGISVAGIPLLFYAFLNIKDENWGWMDYGIIVFFPFYSKLALAGFFIAVMLFLVFIWDGIKQKRINVSYLLGLILLTAFYCFTHYHLVRSFIAPDFVTFREEIRAMGTGTSEAFWETAHNFIFDRTNEVSAQGLFVLGAAALALLLGVFRKIGKESKMAAGLVLVCLVTAVMWGFKYWNAIIPLREKFQLLNAFDFSRFFWLNPFFWYLAFALSLLAISKLKWGKVIASVFIVGQVLFMLGNYNWEYRSTLGLKTSYAGSALTYSLTYKQFVSEELYGEIAKYIGKPKKDYRVVSLGIHPGIAQYNGFYTLDIYTDIYPLEYKHKFEKIIERELAKSAELRRGFSGNAKRCFLMVSEIHGNKALRGLCFTRGLTKDDQRIKIRHLDLNTDALKALGGSYILSGVEIENYSQTGLAYERSFKRDDSPWKIYLYSVL